MIIALKCVKGSIIPSSNRGVHEAVSYNYQWTALSDEGTGS